MAEVIEIVSSSPPASSPRSPPPAKPPTIPRDLGFALDDFDETGSIDFDIDRPCKRRRFSPNPGRKTCLPATIRLDFSSDYEELPELAGGRLTGFGKRNETITKVSSTFDDIPFSSSAPELGRSGRKFSEKQRDPLCDDPADAGHDDFGFSFSQPEAIEDGYSNRTAQLLAKLSHTTEKDQKIPRRAKSALVSKAMPITTRDKSKVVDDIVFSSSPAKARATKPPKPSEADKAEKAAARAAAKASRDAEKEAAQERKRLDREQKAREKQKAADLAEVNKSKTNKKNSAPEMIVDVTGFLQGTSIGNQVEEYMKQSGIELTYFEDEFNLTETDTGKDYYGNIVRWRRKVASAYNNEDGQWEPASRTRIEHEKHVLIHLSAVEFAATIAMSKPTSSQIKAPTEAEMKANLDAHVASIRGRYNKCIPIYLIEGLTSWLKKNVNAKNRQYTAAVRAQMEELEANPMPSAVNGSQGRGRKRKKPAAPTMDLSFINAEQIEDLLLHLQLAHQPIFIQQTTSAANTASQILTLTQHLSTRPYRLAQLDYNLKTASFCMDSGQVKTGENARETFVKMLQEVQRVTPSMAYGILDGWSTVRKLVAGFDKHGNLLLADVKKSTNKDGGWSERRLGPMVSKRLYKVFMGRDPSATDGMA